MWVSGWVPDETNKTADGMIVRGSEDGFKSGIVVVMDTSTQTLIISVMIPIVFTRPHVQRCCLEGRPG